jgi:hypothetical protein
MILRCYALAMNLRQRIQTKTPRKYEVKCVVKLPGDDTYTYTTKDLIAHDWEEAFWYIKYWNGLGQGKYDYTLTGVVEDLTSEEHDLLSVYEGGTNRLYIAKK